MAVPPSARPRRRRPTLSAKFSAAAGEFEDCPRQGEKLVLVVGPLHQGDGDAPAGAGGDGTMDVAAAEGVGETLDLKAELGGIDAIGAVHRQHQRQIDLFRRRGIRRPGCRPKRQAEAQTEGGPPQSGLNKAQQLHGVELTMPGARPRAALDAAGNTAEIQGMTTVMTQQASFSAVPHPELIDPFGRHDHLSAGLGDGPLRLPLRLLHGGGHDLPAEEGGADPRGARPAVLALSSRAGVRKLRLTGGEPLVRETS